MNPFLPALIAAALLAVVLLLFLLQRLLFERRARLARERALRDVRSIERETTRQLLELLRSTPPRP